MKKSEHKVTLPISDYNYLITQKEEKEKFEKAIIECFKEKGSSYEFIVKDFYKLITPKLNKTNDINIIL